MTSQQQQFAILEGSIRSIPVGTYTWLHLVSGHTEKGYVTEWEWDKGIVSLRSTSLNGIERIAFIPLSEITAFAVAERSSNRN